jgi:WD40 repeat protein
VDVGSGRVRCTLAENSCACGLAFHPDGERLAVGCRGGWTGVGPGVRVWDVATGRPTGDFRPLGSEGDALQLHFIDGGNTLLALAPHTGRLRFYEPHTGLPRDAAFPPALVRGLATRPSDARVAVFTSGGTVEQWDLSSGRVGGEPMVQPHPVVRLSYSPDGRVLAVVCQDNAVRLWDSETGLPLGPPLLHSAEVLALGFTDDGATLVTTSAGGGGTSLAATGAVARRPRPAGIVAACRGWPPPGRR